MGSNYPDWAPVGDIDEALDGCGGDECVIVINNESVVQVTTARFVDLPFAGSLDRRFKYGERTRAVVFFDLVNFGAPTVYSLVPAKALGAA